MNFTFHHKRISGLLTVVPANERLFIEEMKNFNFPEARSLKLKEVMGYDRRRLVEPGACVSDLAVFGLQHLFDLGLLNRDEGLLHPLIGGFTPQDVQLAFSFGGFLGRRNAVQRHRDLELVDIVEGAADLGKRGILER